MLDDPHVLYEIEHAAGHVDGIEQVAEVRARWIDHRSCVEAAVTVAADATAEAADR